ncbi:Crp/Fnr family transcriptional regulator [Paenibacillus thalictri]|uniref:Crp/Fnr family transcriptional regulator n=1 Tax=Paenibacillus thalictri TaxID=2527873 RepID=A0A4Q9DJJ5_9BACL|nr:Crp/Fnr family transcriptional regulator [Paenibacillus thalictri]
MQDLSEITLFKDIPREDHPQLLALFKTRNFKKNHNLIFENDHSDEVYFIRSGIVKVYRVKDAQELVFNFHFPGHAVGEIEAICDEKQLYRMASVEAFEPVAAWMLTKKDFLYIINKYPAVLRRAYNLLLERLRIMNRKVRSLTFDDTRTRTANLIMDLYHNCGGQYDGVYRIDFKITQSDLADMLGLTRESISKTVNELKKDGIIEIRQKCIHILDLERLDYICNEPDEMSAHRIWHER